MDWQAAYRAVVSGQDRRWSMRLARCGLALAEPAYRCGVAVRNWRYDRGQLATHRVEVPVVSVGNLTVGGTGKTPFVAWLARWFRDRGVRVSLVSRGYGGGDRGRNDEAQELEWRLPDVPHIQNPDRVAAARVAIDELETQLILLDDGFQHRRLARDLDIVLVDGTDPFGGGHLLPRGLLREPRSSLARADLIVMTRCDLLPAAQRDALRAELQRAAPHVEIIELAQHPSRTLTASKRLTPLTDMPRTESLAFCGIGNPAAFFQTLTRLGFPLVDQRTFPDHHPYDRTTVAELQAWAASYPAARQLLCTHKDLVKLAVDRLGPLPLYAVLVDPQVTQGQDLLEAKLHAVCERIPPE